MTFNAENLQSQIPFYLTAAPEQKALVEELDAISRGAKTGYYIDKRIDPFETEMLQGDSWCGLQLFSFVSGERRAIRGIILSNSCDITPENERALPPKIVFAPIIKLSAIEARLVAHGHNKDQIEGRIAAMKAQSVTSIFYLPAGGPLEEDHIALLDDLHSMPFSAHTVAKDRTKLLTLSMAGFYMFAFKLSVHFCRLQENLDRSPGAEAG